MRIERLFCLGVLIRFGDKKCLMYAIVNRWCGLNFGIYGIRTAFLTQNLY